MEIIGRPKKKNAKLLPPNPLVTTISIEDRESEREIWRIGKNNVGRRWFFEYTSHSIHRLTRLTFYSRRPRLGFRLWIEFWSLLLLSSGFKRYHFSTTLIILETRTNVSRRTRTTSDDNVVWETLEAVHICLSRCYGTTREIKQPHIAVTSTAIARAFSSKRGQFSVFGRRRNLIKL